MKIPLFLRLFEFILDSVIPFKNIILNSINYSFFIIATHAFVMRRIRKEYTKKREEDQNALEELRRIKILVGEVDMEGSRLQIGKLDLNIKVFIILEIFECEK